MTDLPLTNDEYQVFFFTSRAYIPFHFAVHPWVITVRTGTIDRWEVLCKIHADIEHFGYVHKNFYTDPTQGIEKSAFTQQHWNGKLLGSVTGGKNSLAHTMLNFIQERTPDYPHQENYTAYPGPNSNTYVAWILKHFPESDITLPWNAFGKKYS